MTEEHNPSPQTNLEPVAWIGVGSDGVSDVTQREDIAKQWTSDGLDVSVLVRFSEYERVKAERDEAVAKLNDLISEDAAPTSLFERYEARSEALEAEVKRLCNLLNDTVVAWEALPGGQQSVKVVEKWLAEKMSTAINRIRAALEASR